MGISLRIVHLILLWIAFASKATTATSSSSRKQFFLRWAPWSEETTSTDNNKRPRFFSLLDLLGATSVGDTSSDESEKTNEKRRRRNQRGDDATDKATPAKNPFSFFRRSPKSTQPTSAGAATTADVPVSNATKRLTTPWQRRKSPESSSLIESKDSTKNVTTTTNVTEQTRDFSSVSSEKVGSSANTTTTTNNPTKKRTWGLFRKHPPQQELPPEPTPSSAKVITTTYILTDGVETVQGNVTSPTNDSSTNGTATLNTTDTNVNATSSIMTNATTTKERPTTQSQPASPSGIVISQFPSYGNTPQRYYRKQQPGGPLNNMSQQNSVILAEVLVSIFATATRLWFLTWLARRLASQEEAIQPTQHFVWERLNDRYQRDSSALSKALQAPPEGISAGQWRRDHVWKVHSRKRQERIDLASVFTRTVVVIELSDDPKEGISLEQMPEVVTFLLQQHRSGAFGTYKSTGRPMEVEVVFLVQSPGGGVSTFGLAASQMRRLSNVEGITTTAVVDKIAASGGYMIASQAHKLLAAPFSSLGSIGVMMEGLNFNELAEKYGIKPLILKAGTNKNPLSTFGRVSDRDIRNEEERLAAVHEAFKELVVEGRPALGDVLDRVADGSVFLGKEAFDLQMIDGIMTSDEYILERIFANDRVLKLHRSYQARFPRRVLQISPLDLLPHLKSWIKQMNAKQLTGLLTAAVQVGGIVGVLQQVLTSFQLKS
jgi:serine protease SohB